MSPLLDLIFSFVIGSIVVALLNGLVLNLRSSAVDQSTTTSVQAEVTTLGDVVEHDFRQMGYRLAKPPGDSAIVYAGADSIRLRGDFDDDGVIDDLRWSIGRTTPSGNINPSTRFLVRRFNGAVQNMNLGATSLLFSYYDTSGAVVAAGTSTPSRIASVRIAVSVASVAPSEVTPGDTHYVKAGWETLVRPKNLPGRK